MYIYVYIYVKNSDVYTHTYYIISVCIHNCFLVESYEYIDIHV